MLAELRYVARRPVTAAEGKPERPLPTIGESLVGVQADGADILGAAAVQALDLLQVKFLRHGRLPALLACPGQSAVRDGVGLDALADHLPVRLQSFLRLLALGPAAHQRGVGLDVGRRPSLLHLPEELRRALWPRALLARADEGVEGDRVGLG